MSDQADTSPDPVLAPRRAVRLAWWFGIYFAAQLPLIGFGLFYVSFFYMFPEGLISPYLAQIWPIRPTTDGYGPWDLLYTPVLWVGYFIYAANLALVLLLPSRRASRILLVVLTVVVLLNLGGCALTLHDGYGGNFRDH